MKKASQLGKIGIEEIKIFEDEKNTTRWDDAHDQEPFSSLSFRFFYQEPCGVVNRDGQGQNQNIDRYEGHIKDTACNEKQNPTIGMGDEEVEKGNDGKEY